MKTKILISCFGIFTLISCGTLDLNPLSDGSSETWNSNKEEIEMSLNGLYKDAFWMVDNDDWTDDLMYRGNTTPITDATLNGETGFVTTWWANTYKAIARANIVLESLDRAAELLSQQQINQYAAEARFVRACQYSRLLSHFGNIVYTEKTLDIDEALNMGQSDPQTVLQKIYDDFDFAAANLKPSYSSSELKRATAGAALAMKARIAIQMEDWVTAHTSAKACMDLGIYKLHPEYSNLFLTSTKNSVETIFGLPRSISLGVALGGRQDYIPRNAGGWGAMNPTWDVFCSYLCTDGLPIDESPLFDPRNPFKNRDPRCTASIVEFQTPHLNFMYQPHPDSVTVRNFATNAYVENKDTRTIAQFASFNGLIWKKGVANDWLQNSWRTEADKIIIRYADILLMYAEAKMESGNIDDSVLEAINMVRARAYKADYTEVTKYPAVTTTNPAQLRKIIRTERRMEFTLENIRYMDLIRWKLAEKVLNTPNYGMLDPEDLKKLVVQKGLWFFPETPIIDEDGIVDFSFMLNKGLVKQLNLRKFDANRQYLWPIPTKEILTSGLKQNPNY